MNTIKSSAFENSKSVQVDHTCDVEDLTPYIRVKVTTGAKKEIIKKTSENSFNISVKEKAERNLANKRIKEILSDQLQITSGSIKIITGHHGSNKVFEVKN